jgi:hypothetical protein
MARRELVQIGLVWIWNNEWLRLSIPKDSSCLDERLRHVLVKLRGLLVYFLARGIIVVRRNFLGSVFIGVQELHLTSL